MSDSAPATAESDIDISVLLPVHNGERYIAEAVESVLDQRDVRFELVIVDDRSDDATPQILASMASADERVVVVRRVDDESLADAERRIVYEPHLGHSGLPEALNVGLRFCRARYVARMDGDDICLPFRLKKQFDFMEAHPDVGLVCCNVTRIDSEGRLLNDYHNPYTTSREMLDAVARFDGKLPHPSWFVRKSVYDRLDGYDRMGYGVEDMDLLMRLSELEDVRVGFLHENLMLLRVHSESLSYMKPVVPHMYAIHAVVRHRLRASGAQGVDAHRQKIFEVIERVVDQTGLAAKVSSYKCMVSAYIALKQRRLVSFLRYVLRSLWLAPSIALGLSSVASESLTVVERVIEESMDA